MKEKEIKVRTFIKCFVFGYYIVSIVNATIINIPADVESIQGGIELANDGDTVLVQPGTYVENINFKGKNIVVGSLTLTTGDTSYISQTVIDGDSSASVVTFENGEDSTALLVGFILTNGKGNYADPGGQGNYADYGGAIYCNYSNFSMKYVTISGNVVSHEELGSGGGGIFFLYSNPRIMNVTITGNTAAWDGGGFASYHSSPRLENVTINGNIAGAHGGGICCYRESNPILVNVTISGNLAYNYGGGVYCYYNANPSLVNTILWNNMPEEVYFSQYDDSNSVTIAYSDIEGGETMIVTNENGSVIWLGGNIDADPFFVNDAIGDFHLQESSPCIDAGTAFFVWEGDTLINLSPDEYNGDSPDMGAFESPYTIGIDDEQVLPNIFALHRNYPNPFNPETTISYRLPGLSFVNLSIYNITGQLVEILVNEKVQTGYHSVTWNSNNVGSGVYFYKITAGKYSATGKCLLLK